MTKWTAIATAALMVGAMGAVAAKAEPVADRQASMKAQGAAVKAISDYSRGKGEKDAALKAAQDIAADATKNPKLFTKGTSTTDMPGKSHAKPVIWDEQAKFNALFTVQKDKATKLADVIKTGTPDDVSKAVADMGKTACTACHSTYRETVTK